ncbi:MAG TPA: hypothetical protein VGB00_18305 [Pyrinomonadaceae bacterium]|jgi:hypothetical protein
MKMLCGVPVRAGIAAAGVTARFAQAQADPTGCLFLNIPRSRSAFSVPAILFLLNARSLVALCLRRIFCVLLRAQPTTIRLRLTKPTMFPALRAEVQIPSADISVLEQVIDFKLSESNGFSGLSRE